MHQVLSLAHSAKDTTFDFDAIQGAQMQRWITGGRGVIHHDAVESSVIGFAHDRGHAHFSSDAGENEVLDAFVTQQQFEIGVREGTFARLVDHRLARQRVQFVYRVVAHFTADQQASQRAGGSDP